jgi:hypothetical protein
VNVAGDEIVALHTAFDELGVMDERKVRVIDLRFFFGCTNEETSWTSPGHGRPRSGLRQDVALPAAHRAIELTGDGAGNRSREP